MYVQMTIGITPKHQAELEYIRDKTGQKHYWKIIGEAIHCLYEYTRSRGQSMTDNEWKRLTPGEQHLPPTYYQIKPCSIYGFMVDLICDYRNITLTRAEVDALYRVCQEWSGVDTRIKTKDEILEWFKNSLGMQPGIRISSQGTVGIAIFLGSTISKQWRAGDIIVFWEDGNITTIPDSVYVLHNDLYSDMPSF